MKKLLQFRVLCVIMLAMFGISAAAETASVSIAAYATANSWSNGTQYATVDIDGVATATATSSVNNGNTGKYYTSGNEWRLYQTEKNAKLTISGNEGYTVTAVKVTYSNSNNGTLIYGGNNVASATSTTVTGNSIEFTIGSTKNGTTNGQVKVTAIEVTYTSTGSVVIAKPAFGTENGLVAAGTTVALTCTTEGADIYYATEAELDNANPTAEEVVAAGHKGNTITVDATNTYFAVATDGESYSAVATASYTVLAHAGTEADPYNVADAIIVANANGSSSTTNVYVTGYIAKITSNTAIFITDAEDGTGDQLEIYRATNANDFEYALGDKVVVCAPLMMYNNKTPETNGGTIISVTGKPECGLEWSVDEFTFMMGETELSALPTLVNPNNLTVTYSSADEAVATIAADGTITIVAPGVTIITAKFAGNKDFKAGEAEYILVVDDPSITELICIVDFSKQTLSYGKDNNNNIKECAWVAEDGTKFNTIATVSGGNSNYPRNNNGNLRLYKSSNNIMTVTAPTGFYFAEILTESPETVEKSTTRPVNVTYTVGSTSTTVDVDDEGTTTFKFDNPTNVFSFNVNGSDNANSSDFSEITLVIKKYSAGVELYDGDPYGNAVEAECGSISYLRDFTTTNWQPWYVPFAVAADEFEQVVELTGADAASNTLEFTTVTGTLAGNKPYMVKSKAAETVLIEAANGTLLAAASESVEFNGYSITGTYDEKTDMFSTNSYAIAADGNFHPAKSNAVVLKPFRVYLNVPSAKGGMPVRMVIDDEEVTGIEGIYVEDAECGAIYDLQGRRVNNPQGGIFIVNGKKAFINK